MSEGFTPEVEKLDDEAGRMTLEDAQKEAYMIKALLDKNKSPFGDLDDHDSHTIESAVLGAPKGGPTLDKAKVSIPYHSGPDANDYDRALKSLEKLVKLTEDPTLSEKAKIGALHLVFDVVGYILAWPKLVILAPLKLLATLGGVNPEVIKLQEKAKKAIKNLEREASHNGIKESMVLEEETDQKERDEWRKNNPQSE